ncbi:TPA: hypothetical protein RI817_003268 [Vibrio cholerae]|uniref:hypothetical protein n=1 Tax=Vibrio cholerae TaxID=666 RepID=UPI00068F3E6C|nr:hypothetical protein [Vibrio cholerae]QHQ92550.1 hypothetical protein FKV26_19110 [Vibrio cholerae O1]AOY46148.1 hypothetical protein NH62_10929 [Vibrio cholerae]AOY49756.1 hypothetical protein AP033_10933 [Vibrio cholerae]MCX9609370.1 hypothetical protein [Vibrio cholerae]MVB59294.1 hypothetical protein [Vibrio cholerae]
MEHLKLIDVEIALSNISAIKLHKPHLESHLANIPKEDPFYDDLNQLLQLCDRCQDVEVSMNEIDIALLKQVNALSDQLSSKLNHLNSAH